jgi:hydroxyacylglutathione hydrolase
VKKIEVFGLKTGRWAENCWVVKGTSGGTLVIDPGDEPDRLAREIESRSLRPVGMLATHGHHDHVAAAAALGDRWGIPLHLHPADMRLVRRMNFFRGLFDGLTPARLPEESTPLVPGEVLRLGEFEVHVIATPGHTPGGVTFSLEAWLFPGDLLLPSTAGRTDLPGGDRGALMRSLATIGRLSPDLTVFPGHGDPFPLGEGLEAALRRLA